MATMLPPEWWKLADANVGGFENLRFDPSWFANAKVAPEYTTGPGSYGQAQFSNPWKIGDLNYQVSREVGDSGTQTFNENTAWANDPLMAGSNYGSTYRFLFDDEGNPTRILLKNQDKVGQYYDLERDENGKYKPVPKEKVHWETNPRGSNIGIGSVLAAIAAAAATAPAQAASGGANAAGGAAGSGLYGPGVTGLSDAALLQAAGINVPMTESLLAGTGGLGASAYGATAPSLLTAAGIAPGVTELASAGLTFAPEFAAAAPAVGSAITPPSPTTAPPPVAPPPGSAPPPAATPPTTIKDIVNAGKTVVGGIGAAKTIADLIKGGDKTLGGKLPSTLEEIINLALKGVDAYNKHDRGKRSIEFGDKMFGQSKEFEDILMNTFIDPNTFLEGPEGQALNRLTQNQLLRTDAKGGNLSNDTNRSILLRDTMMKGLNDYREQARQGANIGRQGASEAAKLIMEGERLKDEAITPITFGDGISGAASGISSIIKAFKDIGGTVEEMWDWWNLWTANPEDAEG